MSTSGGLIYHLRAIRYSNLEWKAHRAAVARFLDAWMSEIRKSKEKQLVLIGPSGGYSLPTELLDYFEKIVVFEPDWLARKILARRFQSSASKFQFESAYDFESALPQGAVLFCNVLGQIEINDLQGLRTSLQTHLCSRTWASYHDAFSGHGFRIDVPVFESQNKAAIKEIESWITTKQRRRLEANAHLAPELFETCENLRFYYWEWRLASDQTHLIEGLFPSTG